ncbi:MAG: alpha/beta fold hydrolase, partial [Bacteroidota bacterium]
VYHRLRKVAPKYFFNYIGLLMKPLFFVLILFPMIGLAQKLPSIADKSVNIDGITIAYKDEGAGQVILCLHALGHSSKDFTSLYHLPLEKYRVIALDFPGQGNSSTTSVPVSSSFYYSLTNKFIQLLELKNIIIVGNSIGGAVAIRIANDNPNVKLLSLSNPAGLDERGFIAPVFLNFMIHFFQRGVKNKPSFQHQFEQYYKKVLVTDSALERRNEIINDAYRLAPLLVQGWTSFKLKEEDLRPIIKNISCPVLFTWAMKDKFVQFGRNKKAIAEFKNQSLIKYPIGHTPYIELPERFNTDLLGFIESH